MLNLGQKSLVIRAKVILHILQLIRHHIFFCIINILPGFFQLIDAGAAAGSGTAGAQDQDQNRDQPLDQVQSNPTQYIYVILYHGQKSQFYDNYQTSIPIKMKEFSNVELSIYTPGNFH